MKAVRSPLPAATWRSRQFSDALSVAPSNHLMCAFSKSQSRTRSHLRRQVMRSATPLQNFSGSATEAAYSSWYAAGDLTNALAEKPAGGG